MDIVFYFGLIILLGIGLIVGLIFLGYWIPKKLGRKSLGKIIAGLLSTGFVLFFLFLLFEDSLFFKSDARSFLRDQKVELVDEFIILNNSSGGFRDYYHKFELEISEKDKKRIIQQIESEENYQDDFQNTIHLPGLSKNRFEGDTLYANYQNKWEYKKEVYYPNGTGYAPTFRIISISKEKNRLTFEEIID